MTRIFIIPLLLFLFTFLPSLSHAACTNPAGVEAEIVYNTDHNVMQFCNDTNWVSMAVTDETIALLSSIGDVQDTISPGDGQVLTWDNTNGEWIAADGVSGFQIPDDASVCDGSTDGTIRYNSNKLQLCVNGTGWTDVAGTGVTTGKFIDGTNTANAVYTTGNVGIGTATPSSLLHVDGNIMGNSVTIANGVTGQPAPTGWHASSWRVSDSAATCDASTDGTLKYTSSTLQICINGTGWTDVSSTGGGSLGNLAITGAALYNPAIGNDQAVTIAADSTANTTTASIALWGASNSSWTGDVHLVSEGSGAIRFFDWNGSAWTQNMTITSDGNVGIGTTTPAGNTHIYGGANTANLLIATDGTSASANASLDLISKGGANDGLGSATAQGWQILARSDSYSAANQKNDLMTYYWDGSGWTYAMSIDSLTGNVGIGTADPLQTLHLEGTFRQTVPDGSGTIGFAVVDNSTGGVTNVIWYREDTMDVLLGTAAGDVINRGTASGFSDRRLKADIETINTPVLDKVAKLAPSTFKWRQADGLPPLDDAETQIGVIAQDTLALFPEIVTSSQDETGTYYAVNYGGLSVITVKAIQELKAANDQLRADNDSLLKRIEAIENTLQ